MSHSLSIKKAERAVLEELTKALEYCDDSDFELHVTRVDDTQDEIDSLKRQLAALEGRATRAKDAYLAGIDTMDEYKRNKENIERRREELTAEIAHLENTQPTLAETGFTGKVQNVVDILKSGCDMKTKQIAIRTIIDRIVYNRPDSCLEVYYRDM